MVKIITCLSTFSIFAGAVGFAGCAASGKNMVQAPPEPAPVVAAEPVDCLTSPRGGQYYATLWTVTSAEYEALARQVYAQAWPDVREAFARHQEGDSPKRAAIVMDLDETVFDNSGYQHYLATNNTPHTNELFDEWVSENYTEIGAVPGAIEFIRNAEDAGITVFYITNRGEAIDAATIRTLDHLGISTDNIDMRLYGKADTSSKEARRNAVRQDFDIIAFFGDNLDDFSDDFRRPASDSAEARKAQVERHDAKWGTEWFVLPNPMYGAWMGQVNWENPGVHFEGAAAVQ